ncbi:MAG TPA: hypothetical protein DDW52_04310 [Planctomycetaceae bacterium]|nr:hypothetical protein [Planctomycetaceae bacterium]
MSDILNKQSQVPADRRSKAAQQKVAQQDVAEQKVAQQKAMRNSARESLPEKSPATRNRGPKAAVEQRERDFDAAIDGLASEATGDAVARVARLSELIESDLPLQSFLELLLPELASLLGGEAAVVWMRAEGASGAVLGVRYRMDDVINSIAGQKKHERLVQLAWKQKQPLLAEPAGRKPLSSDSPGPNSLDAAEQGGERSIEQEAVPGEAQREHQREKQGDEQSEEQPAQPSQENPTGRSILFGPILHAGEPLALLEVVLAEANSQLTPERRQLFLDGMRLLTERVHRGLARRMSLPKAALSRAEEDLAALREHVQGLQQQIVQQIEMRLQRFKGWSFDSLRENQSFAKAVHQLLDSHGLRVVCPECGNPAILRCLRAGNAKHGVFVFDHYLDSGRTFHGGSTTVPLIRVVPKPARRSAISNPA